MSVSFFLRIFALNLIIEIMNGLTLTQNFTLAYWYLVDYWKYAIYKHYTQSRNMQPRVAFKKVKKSLW